MKELQKSQDSESHLSDKRWLYSCIALFINFSSRSFLLLVDSVCNRMARFMVLTCNILKVEYINQFKCKNIKVIR
jgi:hypothetical protein